MAKRKTFRQCMKADPFNQSRGKVRAWKVKMGHVLPHKTSTTKKLETMRRKADQMAYLRQSPFFKLLENRI